MKDNHHLLNPRVEWTARPQSTRLREMYTFSLDRQVHEELHRNTPQVPLIGYYALVRTLRDVNPTKDPLHDIDDLTRAIEQSTKHYRTHPIERELGMLAVEAIQLQKPFILGGNYE